MNLSTENSELLSICIPTYNRDYLIKECLQRVCPVAHKYGVKVYVSDNASPDKTPLIIREFQQQYDNLICIRQQETITPDDNFEFVLKAPDTQYRWLLADNSYFNEESLSFLLEDLRMQEWDLYIASYNDPKKAEKACSSVYTDSKELLSQLGWRLTWISYLIFNKKMIESGNFKRFQNSRFIHTGVIFEYLAFHSCLVKADSKVKVSTIKLPKRGHWERIVFEIFCKDWYLFVMSLPVYYPWESKQQCIMSHGRNSGIFTFQNLMHFRRKKYWNTKTLFKYHFFIKQTVDIPFPILFSLGAFWIVYYIFIRLYIIIFRYMLGRGSMYLVKGTKYLVKPILN